MKMARKIYVSVRGVPFVIDHESRISLNSSRVDGFISGEGSSFKGGEGGTDNTREHFLKVDDTDPEYFSVLLHFARFNSLHVYLEHERVEELLQAAEFWGMRERVSSAHDDPLCCEIDFS
jgi:hypothetical protein